MGEVYECKCNKCGYAFSANLGIGFLFPQTYEDTVNAMKKGTYGAVAKTFFEEHPDGAVDCENVVARCTACGEYGQGPALTMYVPKKRYKSVPIKRGISAAREQVKAKTVFTKWELEEDFAVHQKYDHRCPVCNSSAEIIEDFEDKLNLGELKCARCDGTMEGQITLMWD